ncbi:MAG: FAD-dependent oxidoreductase [Desulfobacteraceae bacterium]|nr:FAD-dependent oxidoreductase [Desulfobacteraceae bacterium]
MVILGGGFIGAEFADEFARDSDAESHVVEMMPIATHPLLISSPTAHPLINSEHQALAKLRRSDS